MSLYRDIGILPVIFFTTSITRDALFEKGFEFFVSFFGQVFFFDEAQGGGVDAVSQAGGFGAVGKNVAEM